jgi:hypothetical protein
MALCDDLRELRDVLVLAYRPTFPSPLPLVRLWPAHSLPNAIDACVSALVSVCVRVRACMRVRVYVV